MWAASGWDAEEKGKGMKGGKKGKSKGKGTGYGSPDDAEALAAEAQRRLEQAIFGPQAGAGEEGDIGEVDVGYTHEFRRYTKQQIVDICSSVEVVTKPDSFVRFDKEHKDAGRHATKVVSMKEGGLESGTIGSGRPVEGQVGVLSPRAGKAKAKEAARGRHHAASGLRGTIGTARPGWKSSHPKSQVPRGRRTKTRASHPKIQPPKRRRTKNRASQHGQRN